ncbi:MAG: tetratricopeptide repeat protein [Cyanobacteria bacterium REEB67]|nr:tetratricopeptide repeat protein [Cyanobacteria bacterium REEB67]
MSKIFVRRLTAAVTMAVVPTIFTTALALSKRSEESVAMLYAATNQDAEAIKHFNSAIKADSENGRLYYERGHTYYVMNQYIQATPDYTRSIQLKYQPSLNYERRAFCYLNAKQYQKGIDDCSEAIKLDPRSRISYFNRAKAYALIGEATKSKEDLARIKELDKNPRAKDFADRCMAVHDPNARVKLCLSALQIDPKHKEALTYLGNAYLVLEKKDKAIECFNKLVALNPDDLTAIVDRSLCYEDFGRYPDAVKDLDNVLENAPECYKAYFWRGRCYAGEKQPAKAISDYKKCEQIVQALMASSYAGRSKGQRVSLGRFLVNTFAAEAHAYEQQGNYNKAIEAMTFAVNESRQAPMMLAKLLPKRSEIYKKAGLTVEAHNDLKWASEVNDKIEALKKGPIIPPPPLASDSGKNKPDGPKAGPTKAVPPVSDKEPLPD